MNKLYDEDAIASIANAIRSKTGNTNTMKVTQMADAITNINIGIIPEGNLSITHNGNYEIDEYETATVNVPSDVYEPDEFRANGTYYPVNHDGFSKIVVNVDDAPELQTKNVTVDALGTLPITIGPDTGYYGLSNVRITELENIPVLENSKTATVNYGQSVTVTPSTGRDAIKSVTVTATAPTGTKSITENGTVNVKDYASAVVDVQPDLVNKSITQNGTYQASTDNADGYDIVTVNVPANVANKSITANGTYLASSDDVDGFDKVEVDIPLGTKTITANGTYNASSDSVAGYSSVTINVPSGATESTEVYPTANKAATFTFSADVSEGGLFYIYDINPITSGDVTVRNNMIALVIDNKINSPYKVIMGGYAYNSSGNASTLLPSIESTTITSNSITISIASSQAQKFNVNHKYKACYLKL